MIRVTLTVDPGDGQGPIETSINYPSLSMGIPLVGVALREALTKAMKAESLRGALLRMVATEVGIAIGTRFTRTRA